jgi:hypothetical protein
MSWQTGADEIAKRNEAQRRAEYMSDDYQQHRAELKRAREEERRTREQEAQRQNKT